MIFRIELAVDKRSDTLLPLNYQYELSSAIYKIMAASDKEYTSWLHDNGFGDGNKKRMKLFCFSNLLIPRAKVFKDRLNILSDKADFYISFLPERSTMVFIQGAFADQHLSLGDRESRVDFRINKVELVPTPANIEEGNFKALSPICISRKDEKGGIKYLTPEDPETGQRIISNLMEKYRFFYRKEFEGKTDYEFKLLDTPKRKRIILKRGTPEETSIIGYNFRFYLKCDKELMNVMFGSGIGEHNAQGFGYIEKM